MKFQLYTPQAIHQLGKRKNQEDAIYPVAGQATAADRLFLVCDGMGGHAMGEVASRVVCSTICDYWKQASFDDGVDRVQQRYTNP